MMATKCAPSGGFASPFLSPSAKVAISALHLIGVVLADELEVHAVLAHRLPLGGLLAAVGEHQAHLGVPGPVIEADLRLPRARRGGRLVGRRCRGRNPQERGERQGEPGKSK